jgi:ammonium transporter, Amt family
MEISGGDTAWVLISCALVLFMTPGLALFYGGMVRAKNVLAMLMANFFTITIVTLIWAVIGFSLAFGPSIGGFIGGFNFALLRGVGAEPLPNAATIPGSAFMAFQLMFAIITPALITGAVAERMKFSAWVIFCALWSLIVYSLVAHWAFSPEGWLVKLGAWDFAGGLVVHINAGIAALALILVLGKRRGWPKDVIRPHSLPLTLLGTGILWFGWFGFNAGSALAADGRAANAFVATQIAAALAAGGWVFAEWLKTGKPTTLGAASGAVAGLVAITPCAGFVGPMSSIFIGLIAGVACFFAVSLKYRFGFDDSLDVIGVHLVGGIVGSLLLGLFADAAYGPVVDGERVGPSGLFYGGADLLVKQIIAVVAVVVFSFIVSYVLALIVKAVVGLRVSDEEEMNGLDIAQHEERSYVLAD